MNGYIEYFDRNNNCMNLLVHNKESLKTTMKYGIRLVIYLKKGLIVNKCTIINTL